MNEELLYQRLTSIIDIPVIETSEIWTKGIFLVEKGVEPNIYIKKGLELPEKLQVLLHEYIHYLHIMKYYENENRAECEFIAESSVFFILQEFGFESSKEPLLSEFTCDQNRIKHRSLKIRTICDEVLTKIRESYKG